MTPERVLAVDVGGTTIRAGAVRDDVVECLHEVSTPATEGPRVVLDRIGETVAAVREAADPGAANRWTVGVGSAGVVDTRTGEVLSATESMPGWAGTRLVAELTRRLDLPVRAVNDVHAHALGEARSGAARHARSSLLVAAGTGIGGGIVADGRLMAARHAVAGHIGHVPVEAARGLSCPCGGVGHLEAIASGPAVLAAFRRAGGDGVSTTRDLAEAAREGDPEARAAFDGSGRALGSALGGLANVLSPEAIVVGGGLANSGDLWWPSLRRAFDDELIPAVRGLALRPAELGEDAALVGAAALWQTEDPQEVL